MIGLSAALDAYVAMLQDWPDLAEVQVLDGSTVDALELAGIAVGATRGALSGVAVADPSAQFLVPTYGQSSEASSRTSFTSTIWAGAGDTSFGPHRSRAEALFVAASSALDDDRTLRGTVSAAWITAGQVVQEQTGDGALVTVEFRIDINRF